MDNETQAALRQAALEAKVIDEDVLRHPDFAPILQKIQGADDVPRALVEMRAAHPKWFQTWDTMDDLTFERQELALRDGLRVHKSTPPKEITEALRAIDAGRLSADDFEFLDAVIAFNARQNYTLIDTGRLRALAARQRVEDLALKGAVS